MKLLLSYICPVCKTITGETMTSIDTGQENSCRTVSSLKPPSTPIPMTCQTDTTGKLVDPKESLCLWNAIC